MLETVYRRRQNCPQWVNVYQIQYPQAVANYVQYLETDLITTDELGATSPNDGWNIINIAVLSSAEAAIGSDVANTRNDWFGRECRQLGTGKEEVWTKVMQHRTWPSYINWSEKPNLGFQNKKAPAGESIQHARWKPSGQKVDAVLRREPQWYHSRRRQKGNRPWNAYLRWHDGSIQLAGGSD